MDWVAGILELLDSWLVENKRKIGFISNFLGCSIWIYVALTTHVYGLLVVVIPALFINSRNYLKWRKEEMNKISIGDTAFVDPHGEGNVHYGEVTKINEENQSITAAEWKACIGNNTVKDCAMPLCSIVSVKRKILR